MNILIVEDNIDVAESIGEFLSMHNFVVDFATDGITAMHLITKNEYDMYLFDISLPGKDGLALCRYLRQKINDSTPIILITARDTLKDKITGFDAGADDYIVKPFQLPELLMRIKAVIKRYQPMNNQVINVDTLCIKIQTSEAFRDNIPLNLTPIGYKILVELAKASPNILSKEKLESLIWHDTAPDSDALRSHLYTLRQKVDKHFPYRLLHTIPKRGIRLYKEKIQVMA